MQKLLQPMLKWRWVWKIFIAIRRCQSFGKQIREGWILSRAAHGRRMKNGGPRFGMYKIFRNSHYLQFGKRDLVYPLLFGVKFKTLQSQGSVRTRGSGGKNLSPKMRDAVNPPTLYVSCSSKKISSKIQPKKFSKLFSKHTVQKYLPKITSNNTLKDYSSP